MPTKISYRNSFKKDLDKQKRRGKNLEKMKEVLQLLAEEKTLPSRYKTHKLVGNFNDRWECHIEPDWLLIYVLNNDELVIERTGSHADLF